MTNPRHQVNESIQGLRGAAALGVMLVHVHFMAANAGLTHLLAAPWIDDIGPFAVVLFFCISGYLITSTLSKHGDVRRFARNRIARIYPLFLILHLIMFSLGPVMNYEWMGQLRGDAVSWVRHFFSNLFFLPGLFDLPIAQKNAWSLSYEAAFYIVAGVLFAGHRSWAVLRGKCLVLLGIAGALAVAAVEIKVVFFAVGSLVWWLERKQRLHVPMSGLLGALGCLIGFKFYIHEHYILSAIAVLPFFASVALEKGWPAAALRSRPLVWLGKVSYSLYLIHPFVLDPLRRICLKLVGKTSLGTAHVLFVFLGITSAIIAAGISHEFIEVRLTRWFTHRPKAV